MVLHMSIQKARGLVKGSAYMKVPGITSRGILFWFVGREKGSHADFVQCICIWILVQATDKLLCFLVVLCCWVARINV